MLLTITDAGKQLDTDALANGTPLPQIVSVVIGAGPAHENEATVTALADQWGVIPIAVSTRLSASAIRLEAEIPPTTEGHVREIGLLMDDGTIYAYGAYQPESDGIYKGAGFAFLLQILLSREDVDTLNIVYTSFDASALAQQVADDASAIINTDFESNWIAITRHLSSLNASVLKTIDQAHKDNGRYD